MLWHRHRVRGTRRDSERGQEQGVKGSHGASGKSNSLASLLTSLDDGDIEQLLCINIALFLLSPSPPARPSHFPSYSHTRTVWQPPVGMSCQRKQIKTSCRNMLQQRNLAGHAPCAPSNMCEMFCNISKLREPTKDNERKRRWQQGQQRVALAQSCQRKQLVGKGIRN